MMGENHAALQSAQVLKTGSGKHLLDDFLSLMERAGTLTYTTSSDGYRDTWASRGMKEQTKRRKDRQQGSPSRRNYYPPIQRHPLRSKAAAIQHTLKTETANQLAKLPKYSRLKTLTPKRHLPTSVKRQYSLSTHTIANRTCPAQNQKVGNTASSAPYASTSRKR